MNGSVMNGSVMNLVCFEWSVMNGLFWTGLFWTDTFWNSSRGSKRNPSICLAVKGRSPRKTLSWPWYKAVWVWGRLFWAQYRSVWFASCVHKYVLVLHAVFVHWHMTGTALCFAYRRFVSRNCTEKQKIIYKECWSNYQILNVFSIIGGTKPACVSAAFHGKECMNTSWRESL